jgi:DNA-binding XRE family transcriptional regulator
MRRNGMKLSDVRKAADLAQDQMAAEVGTTARTISRWETEGLTIEDLKSKARQAVKALVKRNKLSIEV